MPIFILELKLKGNSSIPLKFFKVNFLISRKYKLKSAASLVFCALRETRTPNPLRELAPEASAYTNSATKAYIFLI